MKVIITILFCLGSIWVLGQQINYKNSIKLSSGRILFGTGDIVGYAANVEYAKRLNLNKVFLKHLAVGAELSFEHGDKLPKVINPSFSEFIAKTYHSTTNIVLTPKLSYYPFNKTVAKGINITGGLSLGYTSQSREL